MHEWHQGTEEVLLPLHVDANFVAVEQEVPGEGHELDPLRRQRPPRALVALHVYRLVPLAREDGGGVDLGGGGGDGGGVRTRHESDAAAAVPAADVAVHGRERVVQPHPGRAAGCPRCARVVAFLIRGPDEEAEDFTAPFVRGSDRRAKRLVVVESQILSKPDHRALGPSFLGARIGISRFEGSWGNVGGGVIVRGGDRGADETATARVRSHPTAERPRRAMRPRDAAAVVEDAVRGAGHHRGV